MNRYQSWYCSSIPNSSDATTRTCEISKLGGTWEQQTPTHTLLDNDQQAGGRHEAAENGSRDQVLDERNVQK
jgi:hypothetical protein